MKKSAKPGRWWTGVFAACRVESATSSDKMLSMSLQKASCWIQSGKKLTRSWSVVMVDLLTISKNSERRKLVGVGNAGSGVGISSSMEVVGSISDSSSKKMSKALERPISGVFRCGEPVLVKKAADRFQSEGVGRGGKSTVEDC